MFFIVCLIQEEKITTKFQQRESSFVPSKLFYTKILISHSVRYLFRWKLFIWIFTNRPVAGLLHTICITSEFSPGPVKVPHVTENEPESSPKCRLLQTFTWKEKSYKHCTWHQNTVAIPPSRYFILHAKCVFNKIENSISFSTNSILHLFLKNLTQSVFCTGFYLSNAWFFLKPWAVSSQTKKRRYINCLYEWLSTSL